MDGRGPLEKVLMVVWAASIVAVAIAAIIVLMQRFDRPGWRFLTSQHEESPAPRFPRPTRNPAPPDAIDLQCWPQDGIGSVSAHFRGRYAGDTPRGAVFAAPLPGALDRTTPNLVRDARNGPFLYFSLENHLGERVGYVAVHQSFDRWMVDTYTACDSYTR
jgi:hypothetical protein